MSFIKNNSLKNFRFQSQAAYIAVASKGKRFRFGFLNLRVLPAPDTCNRFCFVVKKKNGNAVFRNRCRRVLRPVFFNEAKNFKSPLWIMAMVDMNGANTDWKALRRCGEEAVKVLGRSRFCTGAGSEGAAKGST
ncbi:MAG: ribonuclease P protein component [Candidatus Fibromonas sp.]|jgi:ribonuclease P protein component|nr:ribonuclease P protein component [Candidatus Fibromonas sp.]